MDTEERDLDQHVLIDIPQTMPDQSATSDALSSDASSTNGTAVPYDDRLEEHGLEDFQVLRRALTDLKLDSSVERQALQMYLSRKSEKESAGPVLGQIEDEEALDVTATLVEREIKETAARIQFQKAKDELERAERERKAASEHLMKVLRRAGSLPQDKECGVDAARGAICELPFDGKQALLELAFQFFRMDASELALIEEHGGELFPEPMQEGLNKIEEEAPDLKARDFLSDLAALLLELDELGRQVVVAILNRPDTAQGLAEAEGLPDPLRFLAHLCLQAAAK